MRRPSTMSPASSTMPTSRLAGRDEHLGDATDDRGAEEHDRDTSSTRKVGVAGERPRDAFLVHEEQWLPFLRGSGLARY